MSSLYRLCIYEGARKLPLGLLWEGTREFLLVLCGRELVSSLYNYCFTNFLLIL